MLHYLVYVVAILNGFACAIRDRSAVAIERTLANGGFGQHDAGIVLIPVGAALNAAGIGLHQNAVTLRRLNVEHDVGLLGQGERPPGGVRDHHVPVAGRFSRRGKGAAAFSHGNVAFGPRVIGWDQAKTFESGRRHANRLVQLAQFGDRVRRDDVDQIDRAAFVLGARGSGSVGDALHLFENFLIETAQE